MQCITRRQFVRSSSAAAGALLVGQHVAAADTRPRQLRAGAALVDITPGKDVRLDGTIMRIGPVREVRDPLNVRALVLDDGRTALAIALCDATMISREIFDAAKQEIAERVGLPADNVLLAATHSHMAVRAVDLGLGEGNRRYKAALPAKIADAVCEAHRRLAPAKIGFAAAEVPQFVQNRRWIMKPGTVGPNPFGETGEQVVMNGSPAANRVRPAGPIDPQLSIVSVQHTDGRPLCVLGNYNIHYAAFQGGMVSADYFGCFARSIAELLAPDAGELPFVAIMSNGTSGNIGCPGGGLGGMQRVGLVLAEKATELIRTTEHRDDLTLGARASERQIAVRRPSPQRIAWARAVQAGTWNKPAHRWKNIYAGNTLRLAEYPATLPVKLQALRIGQLGIAASPCEVFAETGLALKKLSPLKPTFHVELANAYNGYLPPPEQFTLGGYTTWPAESSCLEIGAEPKIRAELLRLLKAVKESG